MIGVLFFNFSQWEFYGEAFYTFNEGLYSKNIALYKKIVTVYSFSLFNTFLWLNIYVKWGTEFKIAARSYILSLTTTTTRNSVF